MEPPKAQRRAFQLTAEEAKATPDVVAGTFLFLSLNYFIVLCLLVVLVIRYVVSKFFSCFSSICLWGESVVCLSDF